MCEGAGQSATWRNALRRVVRFRICRSSCIGPRVKAASRKVRLALSIEHPRNLGQ